MIVESESTLHGRLSGRGPWPRSLQAQIAVLLAALLSVLFLAGAVLVRRTAEHETRLVAGAVVEDLARQMARTLALGMYERHRSVASLASNPTILNPNASIERKRAVLDEFSRRYPEFAWVGLAEFGSGAVLAATDRILEASSLAGRPVFEQGKAGPFVGDVHEAVRLADLVPRDPDGHLQRFVDLSRPIGDPSGQPAWVLAAHLSWSWARSVRDTVLQSIHEQRGIEIYVVNSAGTVLLTSSEHIPFGTRLADVLPSAPQSAWEAVRWSDGEHITAAVASGAFESYPGLGWTVVVRQPMSQALAAVDRITFTFFLGGLVVALLALLAGWMLGGRIVSPFRYLAVAADRIAAGSSAPPLARAEGSSEASRLVRAIERFMSSRAESERRFRLLADTMPQIVWATRPDGYHDYFNERWYEYTGMPRPDEPGGEYDPQGTGQGWNWKDYLHPDDYQHTLNVWSACLASGAPYHIEYRFKRRDGQYRWFIGRALALRNETGRIDRWFGTLTDIHDHKLMAEERDALLDSLKRADRTKDEFLAMLAHELRNPLAPLTNAHRLLERTDGLDERQRTALALAQRQTGQLRRLVDDLLEISRIRQGKIELRREPLDMADAVRSAAESLRASIEARRQHLTVDTPAQPVRVHADPARIAQILENLLNNASKYTPDGGRIRIELLSEPAHACVRVIDNGVGIEPHRLREIFELFSQIDATLDRSQGGLGIGLALVKRLVELHGGSIDAHSDGLGHGACFTVLLPRI